jgi:hypothetical protein
MSKDESFDLDFIAETENFAVWRSEEDEGFLYHIELGSITLHLTSDEWEELLELIKDVA